MKCWFCEKYYFPILKPYYGRFRGPKIDGKSVEKRCEMDIRKDDAKSIKNYAEMEKERKPNRF